MIPFLAPVAAFLNPVGNFLKRIPDWVLWVVAAVVLLKFVDMRAEIRGREDQKRKTKAAQAETRATIVERTSEIITQERNNADQALEARDSGPRYPDFDSLPDSHKAIAFGRSRLGHEGGSGS